MDYVVSFQTTQMVVNMKALKHELQLTVVTIVIAC